MAIPNREVVLLSALLALHGEHKASWVSSLCNVKTCALPLGATVHGLTPFHASGASFFTGW